MTLAQLLALVNAERAPAQQPTRRISLAEWAKAQQ